MNSTPWSASTAQNRSSGLCSGLATNLLDPQGGPPRALRAARPFGRRHPQILADERQVHAALVVLTGPPERLPSRRTRHRPHSIRPFSGGLSRACRVIGAGPGSAGRPERGGLEERPGWAGALRTLGG